MALVTHTPGTVAPEAWCHLIRTRCGLTFRDAQVPGVIACVREQMAANGVQSERVYFEQLAGEADGGPRWSALVQRLVNHETSFFRHPPSFDVLHSHILPALDHSSGGRRLNFWSAGCATGQEAYSIAMVAMDAMQGDALHSDFTVWGGDISRQAVDIARRGRYGPRAIAGCPEEYKRRFLRPVDGTAAREYEVVEEIRRRVRLTTTNLLVASGLNLTYDAVFCHNVIIYFSPEAAAQTVALLVARLAPGGFLLLGPGEIPAERPPMLEPITINGVRLFRRRSSTLAEVPPC